MNTEPKTEPKLQVSEQVIPDDDTDADARAYGQLLADGEDRAANALEEAVDGAGSDTPPPWAVLPPGVKPPAEGTQIGFLRIPAKWTLTPTKGDRLAVCWPLGETDEKLAYARARGDMVRSVSELSKQMIRACDGHKARWDGKPGDVATFWNEIGAKGRQMIRNYYVKTHSVSDEESLDFFSNHFAVVTAQRG
jgi:hypothetical protein